MGLIARGFVFVCVVQLVICKISPYQQPVTQYVYSNYQNTNGPLNTPKPTPPSPPSLPTPVALPTPKPSPQKQLEIATGPSNVLNNLAIALQLLIVSNILNTPEPTPKIPNLAKLEALLSKYESTAPYSLPLTAVEQALSKPGLYSYEAQKPLFLESQSLAKPTLYSYETQSKPNLYSYDTQSKPTLYSYETQSKPTLYSYETQSKPSLHLFETQLPNANFIGSSGFGDPVFGSLNKARPSPRAGVMLMSPYDALGPGFLDTFSSEFPTSYSKDFQSPYASILAADGVRDMFSLTDYL